MLNNYGSHIVALTGGLKKVLHFFLIFSKINVSIFMLRELRFGQCKILSTWVKFVGRYILSEVVYR